MISAIGLWDTVANYGAEYFALTLERGGTSIALLALMLAHAIALLKRGFRITAPFVFAFSYIVVGLTLSFWLRMMGKGFAPASENETLGLYVEGLLIICTVVAAVVWGWFRVWRSTPKI